MKTSKDSCPKISTWHYSQKGVVFHCLDGGNGAPMTVDTAFWPSVFGGLCWDTTTILLRTCEE